MFAVIRSCGKQYGVSVGDVLEVERLDAEVGSSVIFDDVLLFVGDQTCFGTPVISDATVSARVERHVRKAKVIVFKKRRRKNSQRKAGHRQHGTVLRIEAIGA